jgi:ATP-dependent helicase HrpB
MRSKYSLGAWCASAMWDGLANSNSASDRSSASASGGRFALRLATVLRAATGAGKTTRVPPAVLDAGLAGDGRVLVLQPRRVAARAAAARMAAENGLDLGRTGGIPGALRGSLRTGDADRSGDRRHPAAAIVAGPVPVRHRADRLRRVSRAELEQRSGAGDGPPDPADGAAGTEAGGHVGDARYRAAGAVPGRLPGGDLRRAAVPVQISYRPPLERRPMAELAAEAVQGLLDRTPGDVLVFLPGLREIQQTRRLLAEAAGRHPFALYPLYGDLPSPAGCGAGPMRHAQGDSLDERGRNLVDHRGCHGRGRHRLGAAVAVRSPRGPGPPAVGPHFPGCGRTASRASRTHRPGPVHPAVARSGSCARPECEEPEIRRVDLSGAVLQLAGWIEPDIQAFPWFQRPRPEASGSSQRRCCCGWRRWTPRHHPAGTTDRRLPVPPRLGRYADRRPAAGLRGASRLGRRAAGRTEPICANAEPDRPGAARNRRASTNDLLDRINALLEFERTGRTDSPCGRIQPAAARFVLRARDQLLREIRRTGNRSRRGNAALTDEDAGGKSEAATHDAALGRALLAAFPDRLARRRAPGSPRGVMVGNCGVRLADQSGVVDGGCSCVLGSRFRSHRIAGPLRGGRPARGCPSGTPRRATNCFSTRSTSASLRSAGSIGKICCWRSLRRASWTSSPRPRCWPMRHGRLGRSSFRVWKTVWDFVVRVRCLKTWVPELPLARAG